MNYYAGIETGGTKIVCAIGNELGEIFATTRIPTGQPEKSIGQVLAFLHSQQETYPLRGIGIGSFGPIDNNKNSASYGFITQSPKTAWINFDIVGHIQQAFNLPIGFETDVSVAALGEATWGAGQGLHNMIYMTVGTGIGAAAIIDNQLLHGFANPEMGHMLIPQDIHRDPYPGNCPYHGNCLEGLACGPAIKQRWQVKSALDLPADHIAWEIEADYLASALMNILLILSPQRMIVGGGVMKQQQLFAKIQTKVLEKLNDYLGIDILYQQIAEMIVPPALGDESGVKGALALACRVSQQQGNIS